MIGVRGKFPVFFFFCRDMGFRVCCEFLLVFQINFFRFDQYPYYVEREWWKEGKRMTFWATWRMLRDVRRRHSVEQCGPERMRLKALKCNTILPQAIRDECAEKLHKLPKDSRPKLVLNMCQFSGKRRGKIKRFRLSRHLFRSKFFKSKKFFGDFLLFLCLTFAFELHLS